jgi:UDP-N-acetylglucosamine diphosphorylase / glucose-1-phosphate thymidylyltransferase / UDP-N-acetylgalactosamine diphosphorylase / glucosamine-1-phosphate N-acetyltransferase / galactosamine-1-phosphate N-acetyltransferase
VWWRELEALPRELGHLAGVDVHPAAAVDPAAILDSSAGPVVVGAGTKICAGAYIAGPVVLGDDCLVGNYALIRGPARIGNGVRIGFATEIKNAIIGDGVLIGPQCFVADSRIDREAYLGAQVRTSNHRLDKQAITVFVDGEQHDTGLEKLGCHIGAGATLGIQVIVLPGRIVAAGASFGPRITIEKNLPRGRYRLAQQLQSF